MSIAIPKVEIRKYWRTCAHQQTFYFQNFNIIHFHTIQLGHILSVGHKADVGKGTITRILLISWGGTDLTNGSPEIRNTYSSINLYPLSLLMKDKQQTEFLKNLHYLFPYI